MLPPMADERSEDAAANAESRQDGGAPNRAPSRTAVALVIVVAALGYFVDIFDLLLFALVRRTSLTEVLAVEL